MPKLILNYKKNLRYIMKNLFEIIKTKLIWNYKNKTYFQL